MKYLPHGPLMLLPDAYGQEFVAPISPPKWGPVATVMPVRGPLNHHCEVTEPDRPWGNPKFFDNYDSIRERMEYALQGESRTVILAIDSPGGSAVGIFDLVSELRAMAAKAGKSLVTWVDGNCASAGYALACAGEKIYAAPGTIVGSIGVIDPLIDATVQDRALGVKWHLLSTGARKADGNSHAGISEETIAARQAVIDSLGDTFHQLVADSRGLKASDVRALEAATYTAEQAKVIGLVDEIMSLDELLSSLSAEQDNAPSGEKETEMSGYKEALSALRKAAEGDDDDAKSAKKMLSALDVEPDKKDDEDGADDKKAESDEPTKKDDEDEDTKPAAISASTSVLQSLVDKRFSELKAQEAEQSERVALIASRSDLAEETRKALTGVPIATLRELAKTLPRAPMSAVAGARAALGVAPTVGDGTDGVPGALSAQSPELKSQMDIHMGLVRTSVGVKMEGRRLVLGAPVPLAMPAKAGE